MFSTFKAAIHSKETKKSLLFTFLMLLLVRLGSQIPVPGVDSTYLKEWFSNQLGNGFNFLSAITGGSLEQFSIFALGISPYITASIIIQLLSVVFPSIEEMQRDGEYGKKKLKEINFVTSAGLALLESIAMTVGFGKSGLIPNLVFWKGLLVIICLSLGSVAMVVMGELIEKKGIGNGISLILLINIISRFPSGIEVLYENTIKGKTVAKSVLAMVLIILIAACILWMVVMFNEAQRNIPVNYSSKYRNTTRHWGSNSTLPVKLNIASVVPVIFTSSILSLPQMVAAIMGKTSGNGIGWFFINSFNQGNWFSKSAPQYSVGILIYVVLTWFFSEFYVSLTFNAKEVAANLKKSGASIPGYRPGKPTEKYLASIIRHHSLFSAAGLIILVLIPVLLNNVFRAGISFAGTSLIIVVSVILEFYGRLQSQVLEKEYNSFLKK